MRWGREDLSLYIHCFMTCTTGHSSTESDFFKYTVTPPDTDKCLHSQETLVYRWAVTRQLEPLALTGRPPRRKTSPLTHLLTLWCVLSDCDKCITSELAHSDPTLEGDTLPHRHAHIFAHRGMPMAYSQVAGQQAAGSWQLFTHAHMNAHMHSHTHKCSHTCTHNAHTLIYSQNPYTHGNRKHTLASFHMLTHSYTLTRMHTGCSHTHTPSRVCTRDAHAHTHAYSHMLTHEHMHTRTYAAHTDTHTQAFRHTQTQK